MLANHYTESEQDDAWNQGYEACLNGDFSEENPYDASAEYKLYQSWEDGWNTAESGSRSMANDKWRCGCDTCTCDDDD